MGKSGESDGHSSPSVLGNPRLDRSHASAPSLLFLLTWHLLVVILFLQSPAQPQLLKIDLSHIALCTGGCPCFLFDLTCNYQFLEAVGLPWPSFFPLGRGCEQPLLTELPWWTVRFQRQDCVRPGPGFLQNKPRGLVTSDGSAWLSWARPAPGQQGLCRVLDRCVERGK